MRKNTANIDLLGYELAAFNFSVTTILVLPRNFVNYTPIKRANLWEYRCKTLTSQVNKSSYSINFYSVAQQHKSALVPAIF